MAHKILTGAKVSGNLELDAAIVDVNQSAGTAGQLLSSTGDAIEWINNYAPQIMHEVKLGAALSVGTAVYVSSADGTNMIVSAASNASEATSSKTLGLLASGGVLNDTVFVVTEGLLAGLDTSLATAGDPVWLGTNGAILFGLANKPVSPAHLVFIGIVTRAQQNNGEIFVKVQNGFELNEIHDVSITSVANNEIISYDATSGLWKNKTIANVLGYTPVSGSLTSGYIPKATGSTTLGNSIIYENATGIGIGGTNTNSLLTIQGTKNTPIITLRSTTNDASWVDGDRIGGIDFYSNDGSGAGAGVKASISYEAYSSTGATNHMVFRVANTSAGTNNQDAMRIANSGNVLIGTQTDSGYKLDVNGTARFSGNLTGTSATFSGSVTASSFIKSGGTSSQFLKADGSVDSSTYLTSYTETDTLQSVTSRGNTTTTGLNLGGDITLSYAYPRINLYDTNNNSDYSIINNDGAFSIYDITNNSHRLSIASTGAATFASSVTATNGIFSQVMTNGSTSAFTLPHLALKATSAIDTTGFVGMTFATSSSDNYGYSYGALRSSGGNGDLVWRFHFNSAQGTELMRLAYNGDVTINEKLGIGVTPSSYKLDVNGTARFSSTVTAPTFSGDLSGTASLATDVNVTANNSTDETVYLTFVDGATGTQGIETDTALIYNPSLNNLGASGGFYSGGSDNTRGPIQTYTLTSGGSGYTDGTYSNQVLSASTGTGVYATIDFVVSGGIVTSATITEKGSAWSAGSTINIPALGGTGSGGLITVDSVVGVDLSLYDAGGPKIRLGLADTSTSASQEIGGIYFNVRDANAGGAGDTAAIKGLAIGTSGGGGLGFYTSDNGTDLSSNTDPKLFINGDGNVGIGTTSPLDLLHIKSTTNDARMILDGATGYDAELKFFENNTAKFTLGYDSATTSFVIGTANVDTSPRLTINSSGNVTINEKLGIGTSPSSKFEVYDSNGVPIRFGDISSAISGQTAGYIGMSTSAFSGNNGDLVLYPRTSATSRILLMGGNVGIGTTSPTDKLQIDAPNSQLRLRDTDDSTYTQFSSSGNLLAIRQNSTTASHFWMNSSGYVGLGTNSPQSPLHIYENTANTGTTTGLTIEQDGAGDAQLQFLLTGVYRWVAGIDNSDGDKFKIGRGSGWATGEDITIDGSGNIGLSGIVTVGNKLIAPLLSVQNQINTTSANLELNYANGDGTITDFKDLYIRDGKTNLIFTATGSTKKSTFYGQVGIGQTASLPLDVLGGGRFLANAATSSVVIEATGNNIALLQLLGNNKTWNLESNRSANAFTIYESGVGTKFRIDAGGFTGIGNDFTPGSRLHVYEAGTASAQTIVATLGSASTRPVLQFSESTAATITAGMSIEYDGRLSGDDNKMYINSVAGAAKFTFTSGGNMGIGTTSPSASLEVIGGIVATTGGLVRLDQYDNGLSGAGEIALWSAGGTGWAINDGLGRIRFYLNDASGIGVRDIAKIEAICEDGNGTTSTTPSSGLAFYTSAYNANVVEAMRITSGGKVVIGTTSPFSGAELDVYGDLVLGQQNWAIRSNNANADIGFEELSGSAFSDANYRLYLQSGGNVGIGITNPSAKLHVYTGANGDAQRWEGSGYSTYLGMDATGAYLYQNSSSRNFSIGSNSSRTQLVLDAGGSNVGIGTTNLTGTYGKLTVNGSISLLNDQNTKLEIGRYSVAVPNSYIKLGANSNEFRITNNTDTNDIFVLTNAGAATFAGGVTVTGDLLPATDNTGVVGNATYTWSNGQFTNLTVDSTMTVTSTLNVRVAIDLADSDVLRMGSSDDWSLWYNGTSNFAQIELETSCFGIQITDNGTSRIQIDRSTGDIDTVGTIYFDNSFNRTTANKTLLLSDRGKIVEMDVTVANTLTVPTNASVAFSIGTEIAVVQRGIGQTQILPASGVTLRYATGTKLIGQYAMATLVKVGTDEWYLVGALTT